MKPHVIFLLFIVLTPIALADVSIKGFIHDEADVLTQEEEQQIIQILQPLHDQDLAQIAIVTTLSLEGQSIEDVALTLAEGSVGTTGKDNGLLLLIAVKDRGYRFEVGRGLEPIFNDAKVGRYGREFLTPTFREGQYADGIILTLTAMHNELTGEKLELGAPIAMPVTFSTQDTTRYILSSFLSLLFFIFLISTLLRGKHKNDRYFIGAMILSSMMRGGHGGLGRGGFGGFGGGGFGGGGAGGNF